jgi:hypothetical protein
MGDRNTAWVPDRPTGDDFLPPPSGPGPVMSPKDRPYVPNGAGQQPTYRIADLTNPILRPWVVERMKKANDVVLAGKVPYIAREHCWPAGVPGFTVFTRVQPIHFIQTPTKVVIYNELNAEVRRIYLDVPHSPKPKPSWYGESIGRYEGDVLQLRRTRNPCMAVSATEIAGLTRRRNHRSQSSCPHCGGRMIITEIFARGSTLRHRPKAPLVAIRIDTS